MSARSCSCVSGIALLQAGDAILADATGKLVRILVLTGPLFFSGLVFSALLKERRDVPGAMASNLVGAMIGGALEYNAMQFGFASLYFLAAGLYVLAWLTSSAKERPVHLEEGRHPELRSARS